MKGPITGCEHLIAKSAAWKFETSILPGKVSDISRLLLSYIQLFVQAFVPQIMNAITDIHAIVHRSSPAAPEHPWRSPIAESEIIPSGTTTRAPSRLLPSTSPPSYHDRRECMNLYPTTSRGLIPLRLYNSLSQVSSSRAFGSQKLPGAPSVASKRQPETATIWAQHHVNMT